MKHAREDYNRIQDPDEKIPDNEPVFLLRGQDVLAPNLLREWARQLLIKGGSCEMAKLVYDHADDMDKWQKEVKVKIPDL